MDDPKFVIHLDSSEAIATICHLRAQVDDLMATIERARLAVEALEARYKKVDDG